MRNGLSLRTTIGLLLIIGGFAVLLVDKLRIPFGRLPGDIDFDKDVFYFEKDARRLEDDAQRRERDMQRLERVPHGPVPPRVVSVGGDAI